jgi:hypothetical protein
MRTPAPCSHWLAGLFDLIKSLPPTLKYEPGTIVAEGNVVIVHGRFSNFGLPVNRIAADIVRIEDGVLAEHWDAIQDEATEAQSKSGQRRIARAKSPSYSKCQTSAVLAFQSSRCEYPVKLRTVLGDNPRESAKASPTPLASSYQT